MAQRIEVIAHRGASSEEPEHSLAAYLRAVEQGADGIECDVRLTRDGVLVCHHDRRINRTSSGRGVVSARTYDELAQHDFKYGHENGHGLQSHPHRSQLLTLRSLLTVMLGASSTLKFSIETKHPNRYRRRLEQALFAMLDEFGLLASGGQGSADSAEPRVRLMSFSRTAVEWMATNAPGNPTAFLLDPIRMRWRDGSLPAGVDIAGPSIETLRKHPGYVAKVRAMGAQVHVWTVDEEPDVDLCVDLGVDAIITNRPGFVRERLGAVG